MSSADKEASENKNQSSSQEMRPSTELKPADVSQSTEDSAATDVNPLTDFVTTSYVIDSINSALNDVMKQEAATRGIPEEADAVSEKRNFFELQKQMPDGSARKATAEEMSSQDMKNKLEQAAQLTSQMTREQKLEWAQKQRQEGNRLYQEGQYKKAIDIYLTCLIVRDTTTTNDKQQTTIDDQEEVLILPVMNNLAQCALQLGWYHKAEVFCTLALETLPEDDNSNSKGTSVAKLYYKRGKARRLRGWYDEAKRDLERAMEKLLVKDNGGKPDSSDSAKRALERVMEKLAVNGGTSSSSSGNDTKANDNNHDKSPEQKAIEKEFQLLAKAVAEGKKNKKRTQRAMQKVLGGSSPSQPSPTTGESQDILTTMNINNDGKAATATTSQTPRQKAQVKATDDTTTPLYHEKQGRTHSTIRKRPEGPPPYEQPRLHLPTHHQVSYWQMYRLVAARVAQRILDIIGEEEGTGFGSSGENADGRPKQD